MTAYSVFASLAPAALVLLLVVTVALWRRRAASGGYELVGTLLAGAVWLGFAVGEIAAPTPETSALMIRAAYLAIPWGPVFWFAFALGFTGHRVWRNPVIWVVSGIGLVTMALGLAGSPLLLTPEASVEVGSFRYNEVEFGPWFWVHIASSWASTAGGAVIIALEFVRSPRPYRQLAFWLALAAAAPLAVNVTYAGGLHPAGKLYTPLAFAISALAFGFGMIRYRLLDLQPTVRSALVEQVSEGLVVLDAEGRVIDFNAAFGTLAPGVQPGDPLAGTPLAALGQGASGEVELGDRHVEWRADAADAARVVVLRDVTERREAEDALRDAVAALRLRNEELDAYAHTVAHDLKTPLQAILGSAELLGDSADGAQRRDVDRIARTARQMNQTLDDLLLLARIRHEDLGPEPLALGEIVARALDREAPALRALQVEVADAWPPALGYAPWVEEVWANLLSNAAKYGGTRIAVGGNVDGTVARLWVDDDGPGVAPEDRDAVFAPLVRLAPSRADGTGLGLAIVKRIVERMGGRVAVGPSPLGGARFGFSLPAPPGPASPSSRGAG